MIKFVTRRLLDRCMDGMFSLFIRLLFDLFVPCFYVLRCLPIIFLMLSFSFAASFPVLFYLILSVSLPYLDLEFCNERLEKGLLEKLENVASKNFAVLTYTEAVDVLLKSGKKFEYPVEWYVLSVLLPDLPLPLHLFLFSLSPSSALFSTSFPPRRCPTLSTHSFLPYPTFSILSIQGALAAERTRTLSC